MKIAVNLFRMVGTHPGKFAKYHTFKSAAMARSHGEDEDTMDSDDTKAHEHTKEVVMARMRTNTLGRVVTAE